MNQVSALKEPTGFDLSLIRVDGGTQSRASLYQNIVDDYAAAIADGASFPPVVVFYDGKEHWLADGFHRYHAHKQAGLIEIAADIRQGTRRDAILYSVGANEAHGLRRTNEDKRRAVLTLLNDSEWVKWSDREIGRQCAVSHVFVAKMRPADTGNVSSMVAPLSQEQQEKIDAVLESLSCDVISRDDANAQIAEIDPDWAKREVRRTFIHPKTGTISTMNTAAIGKAPGVRPFDPHQEQEIRQAYLEITAADPGSNVVSLADEKHVRGTFGTGENEWYTPENHIDLARQVLGAIDLDPASSDIANATVKAVAFYSEQDNGLDKEWAGNVWLNPPYVQPAISHFADKMVAEWESGRIAAALMLTHNYTDTAWFQKLARAATAMCFTKGRVRFVSPAGDLAAPTQGQAFFYFGKDVDIFADVFEAVGFVVEVR